MTLAFILAFVFSPSRGGTRLEPQELARMEEGTERSAAG
jgi:hypothetical protein